MVKSKARLSPDSGIIKSRANFLYVFSVATVHCVSHPDACVAKLKFLKVISNVADPHHFGKLDPDPHQSGELNPDPHQSKKVQAIEGHFGA